MLKRMNMFLVLSLKSFVVSPVRGNIFSEDGSLLATSTTKYDIFFDSKTVPNRIFSSEIKSLSNELSKHLGDDQQKWQKYLTDSRNNNNRYLSIIKNIDCLILDKSYIKNNKIQNLKIKKYFYTFKNNSEFKKYNKKNNLIFENL